MANENAAVEAVDPKQHEPVMVEFTRDGYSRDRVGYGIGDTLEVPRYALPTILKANPPFGRLVSQEELEARTSPEGIEARNEEAARPGSPLIPTLDELPTIPKLDEFLATLTSVDAVRAMQQTDARKSAQEKYEARIAELSQ